jgi:hypothetical protein
VVGAGIVTGPGIVDHRCSSHIGQNLHALSRSDVVDGVFAPSRLDGACTDRPMRAAGDRATLHP